MNIEKSINCKYTISLTMTERELIFLNRACQTILENEEAYTDDAFYDEYITQIQSIQDTIEALLK